MRVFAVLALNLCLVLLGAACSTSSDAGLSGTGNFGGSASHGGQPNLGDQPTSLAFETKTEIGPAPAGTMAAFACAYPW